jgi:hypothetical protein
MNHFTLNCFPRRLQNIAETKRHSRHHYDDRIILMNPEGSLDKDIRSLPASEKSTTITMNTSFSKIEIEEIVAMVRLDRYNRGRTHGADVIYQEMESMGVRPLPSLRTIARILSRLGFTHGRVGHYP